MLLLELRKIGQLQLHLDSLNVYSLSHYYINTINRINLVVHVKNIRIVEAPNDVENNTYLPNRAQKLVSETLSIVSSLDQSSHVDELHFVIHNLL